MQVLLGNRYGYQPFPAKIGYEEFEELLKIVDETCKEDGSLLRDWFVKDENNVPPEYVLQVFECDFNFKDRQIFTVAEP